MKKRLELKGEHKYFNKNYNFPVVTNQEKNILFLKLKEISKTNENIFEVEYS